MLARFISTLLFRSPYHFQYIRPCRSCARTIASFRLSRCCRLHWPNTLRSHLSPLAVGVDVLLVWHTWYFVDFDMVHILHRHCRQYRRRSDPACCLKEWEKCSLEQICYSLAPLGNLHCTLLNELDQLYHHAVVAHLPGNQFRSKQRKH